MTSDDYRRILKGHGYTVISVLDGNPRSMLLQGREGEIVQIPNPDDMDAASRRQELEHFLNRNGLSS